MHAAPARTGRPSAIGSTSPSSESFQARRTGPIAGSVGRTPTGWECAMHQRSLFDDPDLVADLREAQHRKYEAILATGKAAVVLGVARTLRQPFRLNDLSVACHRMDPEFFGMEGYKH